MGEGCGCWTYVCVHENVRVGFVVVVPVSENGVAEASLCDVVVGFDVGLVEVYAWGNVADV